MSGPLSNAEASERMNNFLKIIKDTGEAKKQEINTEARNNRDAAKKRMVARMVQGVNEKYERLTTNAETNLRTSKSNFILESRTECQNDRHAKMSLMKDAVEKRIQEKFDSDPNAYRNFMKDLIMEACIRLLEQDLRIRC